ncbi:uncharacterized protein L199_003616 [Kwoniella botswanensis]|uniref:uncharacterized protein n=1 Tax=Kwoniella botswanensis TaxID=1268659 RepID=UPI00315D8542
MEDLLRAAVDQATELTIMDQVRLATAMTLYRIKPSHVTMQEFLYQCRQHIRVRQARSNAEVNLYKPIDEIDDLRMVVRMMREDIRSMKMEMRKRKHVEVKEQDSSRMDVDEGGSMKRHKSI